MGCIKLEYFSESHTNLGTHLRLEGGDSEYHPIQPERKKELQPLFENQICTCTQGYRPRVARWKSLDPLMAKFPSVSPYVAFDNNPIFYIDPLGLASEVEHGGPHGRKDGPNEGGGGGDKNKYLPGLDFMPKTEFDKKINKSINLFIVIEKKNTPSGGMTQGYRLSPKENYENNSFLVIFATTLKEAEKKAKESFGDKPPQNTVIEQHGMHEFSVNPSTGEKEMNDYVTLSSDESIDRFDLKKYNKGTLSGAKADEFDALAELINWTTDDCVLSSCGVGSDEIFLDRLEDFYQNHVNSGTNFYVNIDKTRQNLQPGTRKVNTDKQVMSKIHLKYGWVLITSNGGAIYLIKKEGNTGDIILDGAAKDTIQIQKKTANDGN